MTKFDIIKGIFLLKKMIIMLASFNTVSQFRYLAFNQTSITTINGDIFSYEPNN